MSALIIIATVTDGLSAEISTFRSNHKAVKHVSEQVDSGFELKPEADAQVEEYIEEYNAWVRDENDNMCDTTISYEIIEL